MMLRSNSLSVYSILFRRFYMPSPEYYEETLRSHRNGTPNLACLASIRHITSWRNINSLSLLGEAIHHRRREDVKILLQSDFMPETSDRWLVFEIAVKSGDMHILGMIIDRIGIIDADISSRACEIASSNGNVEVLRYLLSRCPTVIADESMEAACLNGHVSVVRELIRAGARVHTDPEAMFLHYILDARVDEDSSVAIGPVLDLLVSEGAHVDPSDPVFWCLAGSAASAGFVRHLVSLGPPDEECLGGALEGACMAGQRDVVELLLPIAKEQDGYADLLGQLADTAFDAERTDVLAALLEQYALVHPVEGFDDRCEDGSEDGFDDGSEDGFEDGSYDGSYDGLSQDDSYGGFEGESEDPIPRDSLLIYAAACGDAALVARLLSSGCDVTGVICSSTALAHATDPAIIRMLLDAKADVDPPGCVHMLKVACSKLRPDAVKALLDAGAGVGKDKHDNPALVFAISTEVPPEKVDDHVAIINLLVDAGADTRSLRRGQSALQSCFHCLRMNKENVVIRTIEVLLRRDPGLLECRNEEGLTPLMYLLNEGMLCPAVAKALVDAGADVEAADQRGRTPLHHLLGGGRGGCAKYLEKWEILQLLLGAGARATACDSEGKTVLMDALERPRVGPSWFAADDYAANIFVSGVIRHITTRC